MKRNILLFAAILLSGSESFGQWQQLPTNTFNPLLDVSFPGGTGYAVGFDGTIIKSTYGGSTWTHQASGTTSHLYTVWFHDENNGIAGGDDDQIVRTTDGGNTWTAVSTGLPVSYRDIFFMNADTGFLAGGNTNLGYILKTTDGGNTWTDQQVQAGMALYSVYFTDKSTGYVVGWNGRILKSTDGGDTWSELASNTTSHLLSISFTDMNTAYVSGSDGTILKTTDAGSNWTSLPTGNVDYLTAIKFANSSLGYAIGGNVANNTSTILQTTDAGASWTVVPSSFSRLYGMDISESTNAGYIAGLEGTLLKNMDFPLAVNGSNPRESLQVYPNPFIEGLSVRLQMANAENVSIEIFDLAGKRLEVFTGVIDAGAHTITLGESLPAGSYVLRMNTSRETITRKMVKIK